MKRLSQGVFSCPHNPFQRQSQGNLLWLPFPLERNQIFKEAPHGQRQTKGKNKTEERSQLRHDSLYRILAALYARHVFSDRVRGNHLGSGKHDYEGRLLTNTYHFNYRGDCYGGGCVAAHELFKERQDRGRIQSMVEKNHYNMGNLKWPGVHNGLYYAILYGRPVYSMIFEDVAADLSLPLIPIRKR